MLSDTNSRFPNFDLDDSLPELVGRSRVSGGVEGVLALIDLRNDKSDYRGQTLAVDRCGVGIPEPQPTRTKPAGRRALTSILEPACWRLVVVPGTEAVRDLRQDVVARHRLTRLTLPRM